MNSIKATDSRGEPAFRWRSASATSQGNVRDHNEDAILDRAEVGLWVVADGMGGHAAGDVASRMIVETLAELAAPTRFSTFLDDVDDRLSGVNAELHRMASAAQNPTLSGSTVAALLAFDRYCLAVWAGDSRVYRYRDGAIRQITRDHSEVQDMVDRGIITAAAAESHAASNVITRAVGGTEGLYLDLELRELKDGDRYLLCSDGLYKELPETEISAQLGKADPKAASDGLLNQALAGPCADNVSVIVVSFSAARV